jgi:hypothetical protein
VANLFLFYGGVGARSSRVVDPDLVLGMEDFEIYVDDGRYSVPSLYLITAASEAQALAIAAEMLTASIHHRGVELRRAGQRIYALGSFEAPGPTAGDGSDSAVA